MNGTNQNSETKKPLTENQEQAFELIRQTPGGYLKHYKKHGTGTGWKLMDNEQRPIRIFGEGIIKQLIEKQYLIKKENIIVAA